MDGIAGRRSVSQQHTVLLYLTIGWKIEGSEVVPSHVVC